MLEHVDPGSSMWKRHTVLIVLLASYGLVYFHRTMTGVMEFEITSIAKQYDYDPVLLLSILSSMYFYAYAVSQLLVGSLLDYYGVKKIGSAFLVLLAASTMLMVRQDPTSLIVGRVMVGSSSAAAFLSYQRVLSLYYNPWEQARATALALIVGSIASATSTYPLRTALELMGLGPTLTMVAVATLLIAVLLYYTSSDRGTVGSSSRNLTDALSGFRRVALDRHGWAVSFGALATYGTALSFQSSWGQLALSRSFGLDRVGVSYYLLIFVIAFTATCPAAGYLSDRVLRRRKLLLVASAASMAVFWVLLLTTHLVGSTGMLLTSIILLGVSLGPHIVISVMMREAYGLSLAATSVAFMNTVLFLGTGLLNTVLPRIPSYHSIAVSAALSATGALVVWRLSRETYTSRPP